MSELPPENSPTVDSESESESPESKPSSSQDSASRERSKFRISRLAKKELRETLRDRRTLVTLIVMPLLVYPILSLVFRTFLLNNADTFMQGGGSNQYRILVDGDADEETLGQVVGRIRSLVSVLDGPPPQLQNPEAQPPTEGQDDPSAVPKQVADDRLPSEMHFLEHSWAIFTGGEDASSMSLEAAIASGQVDVGVRLETKDKPLAQFARYKLIFDPDRIRSVEAAELLRVKFLEINQRALLDYISQNTRRRAFALLEEMDPVEVARDGEEKPKARSAISMASLIPLILVLMTITGAVYPAIDLTAGERERGTLETLMAAPIPRMGILFSKFVAVLTVAVLTASLNILGMAATIWAFQLDSFLGDTGFTLGACLKVFGLLILFASFYSAVLLAVTSYARSFKEAQSYLVPIILLSMAPGLMAMTPGLTLEGPLCVTPMVNILLLGRDVLQNNVLPVPSLIAIVSTLFYTGLSILMAARIFGTDAILYGSQTSWSESLRRPGEWQSLAPFSVAVFCLVLLFPINFIAIGLLGRVGSDMTTRLMMMGLFTFLTFGLFPWVVTRHQRIRTKSAFGVNNAKVTYFLAAILLGVSLWPIVMAIISGWHDLYGMVAGAEKSAEWHDRLVKFSSEQAVKLREVPPWAIALALSVFPAVFEEWFFRGLLLRSLLKYKTKWTAILASAVIFGLFHVLSNSVIAMDRLVPTALVGIILGYLCYKSGSILPGIILHLLHNGIVAFLAYYQEKLSQFDWFPDASEPIPTTWILGALVPAAIGIILISVSKRAPLETDK